MIIATYVILAATEDQAKVLVENGKKEVMVVDRRPRPYQSPN